MLSKLSSIPALILGWLVLRGVLIALCVIDSSPRGDVAYYFSGIYGDNPDAMTEYPHPGVWPTQLIGLITGPNPDSFFVWFSAMCLALDLFFLLGLRRFGRDNPVGVTYACWFWIFFGTAAGQVFIMRLDLFPAVAVAIAAMLLFRVPTLGAAFLALATTMKLWPGVLAAGLVGRWNQTATWLRVGSFVLTAVALCGVTVATEGVGRLLSPLTYQGERGLQIESIPATPFIYSAFHSPSDWTVDYAPSKSFEIAGPGVDSMVTASTVIMVIVVLAMAAWALSRLQSGRWDAYTSVAFFVAGILGLIASNKVFSPQYIVWIAPVLAVAMCAPRSYPTAPARGRRAEKAMLAVLGLSCLIAAALGTFIYPFNYSSLISELGTDYTTVIILAVRNALILVMFALSLAWLYLVNLSTAGHSETKQAQPQPLGLPHTQDATPPTPAAQS